MNSNHGLGWQRNIPSVFYNSTLSAQNNRSSNSSSRQSILTRAQLNLDEGAFPTDACGFHTKRCIQVMYSQTWFQNQQGFSRSHLCWRWLNMRVTFDLGIWEDNVSTVRSNLKQSWKQFVVALVGLAACIHQFWSVKSSQVLSSPV